MRKDEARFHFKYDLALVLITLIWSTTFVLAKDLLSQLPPLNYLSMRFLVAALVLALISHRIWRSIDRIAIMGGIVLGVLLYGGFFTQAIGLVYTTPAKSAFVTGVNVILVPFFSYFLMEARITVGHIVAITLACFGFGLLTMPQGGESINLGDMITLLGTSFWALHIVYTGVWTRRTATQPLLLMQLVVTALLFLISLMVLQTLGVLPVLASSDWPLNFKIAAQIIYLSVIATIGTILVQTRAQRHVPATRTGIIFSLEPAFAAFVSYLVLGERLNWRAFVGGALIIVAIIISTLDRFPYLSKAQLASEEQP
ncbi:MAG: DMT family transporter [Acidobacteriota bacterium]